MIVCQEVASPVRVRLMPVRIAVLLPPRIAGGYAFMTIRNQVLLLASNGVAASAYLLIVSAIHIVLYLGCQVSADP